MLMAMSTSARTFLRMGRGTWDVGRSAKMAGRRGGKLEKGWKIVGDVGKWWEENTDLSGDFVGKPRKNSGA